MRRFTLVILFTILVVSTSFSQKKIFDGKSFVIYENRVEQDKYEALVKDDFTIKSNYRGVNSQGLRRPVFFKFSINNLDNERAPSYNHKIYFDPVNGKYITPIFKFGEQEPGDLTSLNENNLYLSKKSEFDVTFRVDMRDVLKSLNDKGSFKTYDGGVISKNNFNCVQIIGDTEPLTWELSSLQEREDLKLSDDDGDGIYEATVHFKNNPTREVDADGYAVWNLQKDIKKFPQFHSTNALINALYNLSMEEMMEDIRDDGAFCAGLKWPGVWTRDISYSIILSLALINPEASKISLMAKVQNGKIIEDTGTGGSWPVSTDRMIWTLAAWEIYCVTGDIEWLKKIYPIIKNSAEADLKIAVDPASGLMFGESSFLDWREQTYPAWMEPKDIYQSHCLGTNAVHYQSFKILSQIANILGEDGKKYSGVAADIKSAIQKYLWMNDKGYYAQYLYGGNYYSISPRSETLGEALCVLFGIADEKQSASVIRNVPVLDYGAPCIYPQIPGLPPYHNNGIWAFVEMYWTWASKKAGNGTSIENGLASIYRAASLFLTNKENYVAENGHYEGTEINSDRQLWSVAGNLASVYRIFFGMEFNADDLTFSPVIPKIYSGEYNLKNIKYCNSILNISVKGYGSKIKEFKLDGIVLQTNKIKNDLNGKHSIEIILFGDELKGEITRVENIFSPRTPDVQLEGCVLKWKKIENAKIYYVFKNGKKISQTSECQFKIDTPALYSEYQVMAVDNSGYESFLSKPVSTVAFENQFTFESPVKYNLKKEHKNFSGDGYITLAKNENTVVEFEIEIKENGKYFIDFCYSNGSGPINTKNMCAIRTLIIDDLIERPVVFPQRGELVWGNWGFSNSSLIELKSGKHIFKIELKDYNENMNGEVNTALLDMMRLTLVEKNR